MTGTDDRSVVGRAIKGTLWGQELCHSGINSEANSDHYSCVHTQRIPIHSDFETDCPERIKNQNGVLKYRTLEALH